MAWTRLSGLAMAAALAAGPAVSGETACWFEGGVVVAPAEVAGIAGDWIIDTGSPQTELHETRAQANGIATEDVEAPSVTGPVRLAGLSLPAITAPVVDHDARTWNLPTPVAGVIGADVLKDYVVDFSFAPCRVRISRPQEAPAFRVDGVVDLAWDSGRPTARASVSDGTRTLTGAFVVATGGAVEVRLADDLATAPGASKPDELYPQGVWLARLAEAVSPFGALKDPAAGLMKPQGAEAGVLGALALRGRRLRFDFPAGKLYVAR